MPGRNFSYHEQKETDYTLQLRQLLAELPPYAKDYFRAAEQKTGAKTRLSYAYDLQVFSASCWRKTLRYPEKTYVR